MEDKTTDIIRDTLVFILTVTTLIGWAYVFKLSLKNIIGDHNEI